MASNFPDAAAFMMAARISRTGFGSFVMSVEISILECFTGEELDWLVAEALNIMIRIGNNKILIVRDLENFVWAHKNLMVFAFT
ncbi:MAG: hypothetical protein ACRBBN_11365 [Methyloligellaceae bacterium]